MRRRGFIVGAGLAILGARFKIKAEESGAPVATGSKLTPAEVEELVALHNAARQEVGVEPVTWSAEVAAAAQKWCDHLVATKTFDHSWGDYGENLAQGTDLKKAFELWFGEKARYKRIGCGKGQSPKGGIWVCYYDPPGNWKGEKPY